jgi:hypothetical protein
MVSPALRYPSLCFWALASVTPLSYLICFLVTAFRNELPMQFVAHPSYVTAEPPKSYIFGLMAVAVVFLLIWNAWRSITFFTRKTYPPKRGAQVPILSYVPGGFGFLSSLFYAAMSFYAWRDGPRVHFGLHIACLSSISLYFVVADWIWRKIRRDAVPLWIVIWDASMLVLVIGYCSAGVAVFWVLKNFALTVTALLGYPTLLVVFMRFAALGWQVLGGPFFGMPQNKR